MYILLLGLWAVAAFFLYRTTRDYNKEREELQKEIDELQKEIDELSTLCERTTRFSRELLEQLKEKEEEKDNA